MALTKIGKEGITGISNASNATAITIDSSEKVGIGLTSPQELLHLKDGDIAVGNGTAGNNAVIGRVGFSTDSSNSRFIGMESFRGGDAANADLRFHTYGGDSNKGERMRIDNAGNVLVGTTDDTPFNNTSGNGIALKNGGDLQIAVESGEALYVNRMGSDGRVVSIRKAGSFVGGIDVSSSAVSYNTSSDYRLKENVDYTWDATARLKQLKPARFNFIIDETNTLVDGFIAHEVSSIVPEAISGTKDAMAVETRYTADDVETQGDTPSKNVGDPKTYSSTKIDSQGIDQSKLVPLLVKTIQELEARITALEA